MSERLIQIILFVFAVALFTTGIYLAMDGKEWIALPLLIIAGLFVALAAVGPSTLKEISANFGKGLGFGLKRHIPTLEEKQIATQAGQKEIPPEIKQKLDQFAEDARRRKDEERAPEDYMVLAGKASEEERYEDGLRLAYAGLQLAPKDNRTRAGLYNVIGINYSKLKSHSLAEMNFQKAIQIDDTFPLSHYNLGVLYSDQNKYDLADAAYQKALELNPKDADSLNNLGVLYSDQKKYDLAKAAYQKVLELNPKYIGVHNNLGILYSDQKKYDLAKAAFNKALELDPNYTEAQENLEKLRKLRGGDEGSPDRPTLDKGKASSKKFP